MELGMPESMEATSKRVQRENLLNALLAELEQNKNQPQITQTGLAILGTWLEIDFNESTMARLIWQEEKIWVKLVHALFEADVSGEMIQKFLESGSTPLDFRDCLVAKVDCRSKNQIVSTEHLCHVVKKHSGQNGYDQNAHSTLVFLRPFGVFTKRIPRI